MYCSQQCTADFGGYFISIPPGTWSSTLWMPDILKSVMKGVSSHNLDLTVAEFDQHEWQKYEARSSRVGPHSHRPAAATSGRQNGTLAPAIDFVL